jgi:CubicO group peptidase (beta-lactamase class C family)
MAAAGLWTTASDLARFAIGIQQSLAGKSNAVISQSMTRQMLTPQKGGHGLGVYVAGSGKTLAFSHPGGNAGFISFLTASGETGKGAVIMMNARVDAKALTRIAQAIARDYRWHGEP